MAKSENQKMKLLYLIKIFTEQTDDNHRLTRDEIIKQLNQYDVRAERKSIYTDIGILKQFGFDIIGERENKTYYYKLVSRHFELAELKILVDVIQSSKFITEKKSYQLIKKLEALTSSYEGSKLQRQVYVDRRNKTMNETIYYNVDKLHHALHIKAQIQFKYCQWTIDKVLEPRHEGAFYMVYPLALTWSEENYYLIGYDTATKTIKHYRVDKMIEIEIANENPIERQQFSDFNVQEYNKRFFSMYSGEMVSVKIRFHQNLIGVVIDRFGTDIHIMKADSHHFIIRPMVALSDKFLSWIISLGEDAEILEPRIAIDRMNQIGQRLLKRYGDRGIL